MLHLRVALYVAPRILVRHYARQHLRGLRKEITFTTPSFIFAAYRKHCRDPVFALVDLSRKRALPSQLDDNLATHLDPSEYTQWASVANASTLATALNAVNRVYTPDPDNSPEARKRPILPIWVLASILSKTPSSSTEAFVGHTLIISYPITASPQLLPLAILLTAYWLSAFRMYAPLRVILRRFITAVDHLQPYHVSLLLRILAQAEPSAELQHMIKLLLDLAIRNHMDLGVRTYRIILENRSASTKVADRVRSHMRDCGYAPNLSHTRAFVRIYGRLGRRRTAARYWRRIRLGEYYGPREEYLNEGRHKAAMLEETLRAYKKPRNAHFYIEYLSKTTARPQLVPGNRLPTLPGPTGIPKKVWMQALRAVAEDSDTSSSKLLDVFRSGVEHVRAPAKVLWVYFVVIKGLMRRYGYPQAAALLKEVWETRERWDARKATIAVETLTMIHRPNVAFSLLLDLASRTPSQQSGVLPLNMNTGSHSWTRGYDQENSDHSPSSDKNGKGQIWDPQTFAPRGGTVDTRAINSFMICLLRSGRPDAVFYIWDTMPTVFRVEPDATSLAILLKAARFAKKCEGALQVAIADFGLGRILPHRHPNRTDVEQGPEAYRTPQRLGRDKAVEGLRQLLKPDKDRVVDGFWRGKRAGDVALRVAWQVLMGNWPILGTFRPPMHAIRRSADGQSSSPISDLFRGFASRGVDDGQEGTAVIVRPYDEDGRTFFRIVPEDMMFRALLDLVAAEDRAGQVPLILTWMRYLMVRPSKDTLATALAYWGEVTLEGPWIESWKGEERNQYIKLLKWMTRWVGRGSMPEREHTQRALRRIRWFRDRAAFGSRAGSDEMLDEEWDWS